MTQVAFLLLMSVLLMPPAGAQSGGVDPHQLWDNRCVRCHGHAGDFSRKRLCTHSGILVGRNPRRDLREFLKNHHAAGTDADMIYAMLLAQTGTEARFKTECGTCHSAAADLVRTSVNRRNDLLVGRSSGVPLDVFLLNHAGLTEHDVPFYLQLLNRIETEVTPPK